MSYFGHCLERLENCKCDDAAENVPRKMCLKLMPHYSRVVVLQSNRNQSWAIVTLITSPLRACIVSANKSSGSSQNLTAIGRNT